MPSPQIKSIEFIKSSAKVSQCPTDARPEFAFIGRSNVGKSSLINYLTNKKSLAKTSSAPGKTSLINHFLVNEKWYLVDLPGYGYAKASKSTREQYSSLIKEYFSEGKQLVLTYLLLDIKIKPQKKDLDFLNWLGEKQIPTALVFTKADKISASARKAQIKIYSQEISKYWETLPKYFTVSAQKKIGKDLLLEDIAQNLDSIKYNF